MDRMGTKQTVIRFNFFILSENPNRISIFRKALGRFAIRLDRDAEAELLVTRVALIFAMFRSWLGRLGFVATDGLQNYLVAEKQQEDESRQRFREGWRVAGIRPIAAAFWRSFPHAS